MNQCSAIGNRRSRRSNVLMSASIEAGGAVTQVKLRNLSAEGALIEGDQLPLEGTEVLFRRNDLAIDGRVAWVSGRHAGIAFAQELQPQDVLRNIPKATTRSTPDFKRPGLAARPLTAAERRLIKQWV